MKQFIQYSYDLAGNRTRMIEPGGGRFTCAYDSLNRLSTLENPQSQRTTFSYDDNSRRTAWLPEFMFPGTRARASSPSASTPGSATWQNAANGRLVERERRRRLRLHCQLKGSIGTLHFVSDPGTGLL